GGARARHGGGARRPRGGGRPIARHPVGRRTACGTAPRHDAGVGRPEPAPDLQEPQVTVRTTLAPVHEALTVPLLLVACILGGGFRAGAGDGWLVFSGPPLLCLVLAVLLLGVLAR